MVAVVIKIEKNYSHFKNPIIMVTTKLCRLKIAGTKTVISI